MSLKESYQYQTDAESLNESEGSEGLMSRRKPLVFVGKPNSLDEDRDNYVSFYRGTTYYDALRTQAEGFDAQSSLSKRQIGRQMTPGLYTTRNRELAKYYAYLNSDPYIGFPGQGGPALIEIKLSENKFREISSKYGVIDNRSIEGIPEQVPLPHLETLFPYASLPELYSNAQITVERFIWQ